MTVVDANYFMRYLVRPETPAQQSMADTARTLFEAVDRGEEAITTAEVVLHEVVYVLASKKHYGLPRADIAASLGVILRLPGFKLPRGQKRLYLRAFDLYVLHPRLGFADAIVAARAELSGMQLATFDRDFDRLPGIVRWQPPADSRD